MTDLWNKLKSSDAPIVLYGMGDGADKMIAALEGVGKTPAAVFASDEFVRGQSFHGHKVLTFAEAKAKYPDMTVVVSFGSQLPDVMDNIKRISRECTLLAPDLPVVGDGIFNIDFYNTHTKELDFIYDRLADAQSKKTFECLVDFKLTGNIDCLTECETSPEEAYNNVLKLNNSETYVDLGAYRGDTVDEFLKYAGGYQKIYAVEPDKKNFEKLKASHADTAECINAAASDRVGEIPFDTRRGRSSRISTGGALIPTVTVDSFGAPVSYIKFDVEGNEAAAIKGAAQTILRHKPKMCVAAYHRAYDLVTLPLSVLEYRPDYKLYLRHFPYIPAWDTNYYFV